MEIKPIEVNKNDENELLSTVYYYGICNSKFEFEINDRVSLSSTVDVYTNKLKTNGSDKIFITIEKSNDYCNFKFTNKLPLLQTLVVAISWPIIL